MCPLLFKDLTPLKFEPTEVFFGKSVTVTCSAPPPQVGFGPNTKAVWRLDGLLINEDELHSFSKGQNGTAILTISNFFVTDNGKKITTYTEVRRLLSSLFNTRLVVRHSGGSSSTFRCNSTPRHTPVTLAATNSPSHKM